MSDLAIRVDNLGKRYRIGALQKTEQTFREALGGMFLRPVRSFKSLASGGTGSATEDVVWALRHVSFEVKRGEVVGVIGHNGAGKSTLLKILTRITNPTEGRAEIRGRVGSLLEVGTGFNADLTGRENIYMSGAILGMRKREIDRKFDEIMAFAEVEKFIDTQVKRYSSGMYLRLAFAVSAHLEPEVLLVDEVLAVGDAAFQRKCLGKMGDIAQEGRTILFVSHNMGAIQSLTTRCLLIERGNVVLDSSPVEAVGAYLKEMLAAPAVSGSYPTNLAGFRIESVRLDQDDLKPGFNQPLKFVLHFAADRPVEDLTIGLQIFSSLGVKLITSRTEIARLEPGASAVSMGIDTPYLPPGSYTLGLGLAIGAMAGGIFYNPSVISFEISDLAVDDPFLVSRREQLGVCLPAWHTIQTLTSYEVVQP